MLFFNLQRLTKLKGINRPFSYFMSLGYPRGLASKMAQSQMQTFSVKRLEELCIHFNCTPNDIFEFRPDSKNPLPETHPLYALKRDDSAEEVINLLHDLPVEKIRELAKLLKNENSK